jgi:hypothetical protein
MNTYPRFTLNRHMITLVHKQPFLDWLMSADPHPLTSITLDSLRNDSPAYLIPDDVDGTEDAVKWVEKRWRMFFEYILSEWLIDESLWPKKPSLKMFREWFDVEFHSMIWDLGTAPFLLEDWEGDDENYEDHTYH